MTRKRARLYLELAHAFRIVSLFMSRLAVKALLSVLLLAAVMGVILFATAGTVDYWQAWVYLLIFTITSLLTTIYLIRNDPELLKRRMRGGPAAEKRASQRVIMFFMSLAFIGLLVVPALDRRFGWSTVPFYVVIVCVTSVSFVSVVSDCGAFFHHGGTENTKVAQRRSQTKPLP